MRVARPVPGRKMEETRQVMLRESNIRQPAYFHGLIARPKLLKRLSEFHPITLYQSPAGYGKTTLMLQHYQALESAGETVVWLTLDSSCADLTIFAAYLKAAMANDSAQPMFQMVSGEPRLSTTAAELTALLQAKSGGRIHIFLDDTYLLAGTDSARVLSMLLDQAPTNTCFHLAFRGEPCISVARHRMHGLVCDVGLHDLRFTHQETLDLLELQGVVGIEGDDLQTLEQRLEGWPGGLKLVTLWLKAAPDQIHNLFRFNGELRQFTDFFLNDVVSRQTDEVYQFLLSTSVLERLSPALCSALVPQRDTRKMLTMCESLGLFLLPMDEEREWFRYHPLFADFLRKIFRDSDKNAFREQHRKASSWYLANHHFIEAFHHAFSSDDLLKAAQIIDENADVIFENQESAWCLVDKLPKELVAKYPRILNAQTWSLLLLWQFETAKELIVSTRIRLDEMEQEGVCPPTELQRLRMELAHRETMFLLFADDIQKLGDESQRLIKEHVAAHPLIKGSLYNSLLVANRESFKLHDIERISRLTQEQLVRGNTQYSTLFHEAVIGPARFLAGRTEAAVQGLTEKLKVAERIAGKGSPAAAVLALPLSEMLYELDDLESAQELLHHYLPHVNHKGFVDQAIAGCLTDARLLMLKGHSSKAFQALDEADVLADKHDFQRLHLRVLGERTKWLLRSGKTDEVIRLGRQHKLRSDDHHLAPHANVTSREEARAMIWVRVAQADDRIPDALTLAKQWERFLANAGATRALLRWEVMITHLHVMSGDRRAAQRTLRRAIATASVGRFLRTFLDEGPWLLDLIDAHWLEASAGEPEDDFAREILKRLNPASASPRLQGKEIAPMPVCGALNSRELEILGMVGSGMLNREIGNRMGMTEGSVKWYLQQIYDKIGIRRRSQAVERARQLGVIL